MAVKTRIAHASVEERRTQGKAARDFYTTLHTVTVAPA